MEVATILSVVQTILTAIETLQNLKDTFSSYKKELECFRETVTAVRSVLEEADAKQDALRSPQRIYIEDLKNVIYEADDVLDEFVTLVKQKELTADKVNSFFSWFSPTSMNLSTKVKQVNKKLESIASNNSRFMFNIDNKVMRFTKEETSSFVPEDDKIIGREKDVDKVVEMLLDSNDVDILSVSIVGIGGLGKTALAQLVYNDPRVSGSFGSKYWICIGDQDEEQWSLSALLGKVVRELARGNTRDLNTVEQMQREIEKHLRGRKYLFVLDDVWIENYNSWLGFINFLKVGKSGGRIIVTTRSKKTANIVGGQVHELQGLTEIESWHLFERMAFRPEQRETPDEQLVKVGKEIVKKCMNVPLAIRVVGSLLLGELKSKWELFRDEGFASINEHDPMNRVLKLSYNQLSSSLKSCFTYCAIFPKDFEINKNMLISLWMAQGYINAEDVGEEYFRVLLQRCFFQDVRATSIGVVISFKIHDLLHDIAEQVAGKEISKLNSGPLTVNKELRHLGFLTSFYPEGIFNKAHIRTFFHVGSRVNEYIPNQLPVANLIRNWACLRSLDLRRLDAIQLPDSIRALIHLRYLNLSRSSKLEVLPNSITKLVNLQTLILRGCGGLKQLPKDMYKLVDLRTLDISLCPRLGHLPQNLGKLTKLHNLRVFLVGGATTYKKQCFNALKDLHSLNNLKGSLQICIKVRKKASYNKEEHGGGDYLISKHLNMITIAFMHHQEIEQCKNGVTSESIEWEQSLLEDMQPPVDIKDLSLNGYEGEAMPRWPSREDSSTLFYFPNLVHLRIAHFPHLRFLPPLEKLPNLQELVLRALPNVLYVVNVCVSEARSLGEGSSFYPCLKRLEINDLPKLKGWWAGSEEPNEPLPCFANLNSLNILRCPMLKSIPLCLSLESVQVSSPSQEGRIIRSLPGTTYMSSLPSDSKSRFISISDYEMLVNEEHDPNPIEEA